MGKSAGEAPAPIDYQALLAQQGDENRQSFDYSLGQSRVNQQGPLGSQTWSSTEDFDNAGYQRAIAEYLARGGTAPEGGWYQPPGSGGPQGPTIMPVTPGPQTLGGGRMGRLDTGESDGVGSIGNDSSVAGPSGPSDPGGAAGSPGGAPGGPNDPYTPPNAGATPPAQSTTSGNPLMPSANDFFRRTWTQTTQLSPEQQALYEATTGNQQSAQEQIAQLMARGGLDTSGMVGRVTSLGVPEQGGVYDPKLSTNSQQVYSGSQLKPTLSNVGVSPTARVATPEALMRDFSPEVLSRLNASYDKIGGMDPTQYNEQAADALYRQNARYMDPQYAQEQQALEARLGEQGFVPGTPAFQRELDNWRMAKERGYADARDRAITLGSQVGSQTYGNALQGIQAQIAAALSGGQFGVANDAARGAERLNLANFESGQNNQQFQQSLAGAQLGLQQALANFQMQLGAQQENRAGQAQGWNQGNDLFNQNAIIQQLGRQKTLDANQVAQQLFSNQLTSGNFQNQQRDQQLAEALALRGLPISELNALRSGAAYNVPSFGSGQTPAPGMGGVDVTGAAAQGYGQQLGVYNANVGAQNANTSAIGGIIAAMASNPQFWAMFSDRRLKKDVVRLGSTPGGTPTYEWTYIWGGPRVQGVMADEAPREAVVQLPGGFLGVDYSKVR